ncbi:MAG: VWA domain-containing protein [Myxococcales bacterium]|nr:VWA domain-containing protein [Myxococcales bacterium]
MLARSFDPELAAQHAGILGLTQQGSGHFLASPYGVGAAPIAAPRGESYDEINEREFTRAAEDPRSTFSIDVDTASYSNTRRFLKGGELPPPDAVRVEELINYFEYDYPPPEGDAPFSVISEVGPCPWAPAHRLVHIALKGKEPPRAERRPRNLVFLVDVSGSMSSADKLPLLKHSMTLLAASLTAADRLSIVVYAGAAGVVLPPTRGDDTGAILEALDRLRAGGSTNGGQGIHLAYKLARQSFIRGGVNRVIMASDGDFNVGIIDRAALTELIERKRRSGVYLTVLGFGMGNYQDAAMEQLADKGNGNYAYIDELQEARKVLIDQAGATMETIAEDVKIQVEWDPAHVERYRLIGYENRALAHEDFDDDRKDAGEIGAGHSVTALYEVVPRGAAVDETLMTVNLRYKPPGRGKSARLRVPVQDAEVALAETSNDFRFAASVAEFGMLLRASEHRGDASYEQAFTLARGALGADERGYRCEHLALVNQASALAGAGALATGPALQCRGGRPAGDQGGARRVTTEPVVEDAPAEEPVSNDIKEDVSTSAPPATPRATVELDVEVDPANVGDARLKLDVATGADERLTVSLSPRDLALRIPLTLYLAQLLLGLPLLLVALRRRRPF